MTPTNMGSDYGSRDRKASAHSWTQDEEKLKRSPTLVSLHRVGALVIIPGRGHVTDCTWVQAEH